MMAQALRTLHHVGEPEAVPGFHLAQPAQLQAYGERTSGWEISLSLSLSIPIPLRHCPWDK